MTTVKNRIRSLGITQGQMARFMGISASTLSRQIHGTPMGPTLAVLALMEAIPREHLHAIMGTSRRNEATKGE